MIGLGDWIYGLFGGNGEFGLLFCIFLIFLLDALLFPTLPELFFVIAFMAGPNYRSPAVFGIELVLTAIAAELVGILTLHYIVTHIHVPGRIERAVNKYTQFLVMGDERLLLLNRVAPMIPFAGAFIAIAHWDIKKSVFYIVLGCILKYGFIAVMSGFFYTFFNSNEAQTFTLVATFAIIIISFVTSILLKKRKGVGKTAPQEPKKE